MIRRARLHLMLYLVYTGYSTATLFKLSPVDLVLSTANLARSSDVIQFLKRSIHNVISVLISSYLNRFKAVLWCFVSYDI